MQFKNYIYLDSHQLIHLCSLKLFIVYELLANMMAFLFCKNSKKCKITEKTERIVFYYHFAANFAYTYASKSI